MLGLIVLSAVLTVTLVFGLAAYLIDRSEASLENTELGDKSVESITRGQERLER
jgi:hypothetical protein